MQNDLASLIQFGQLLAYTILLSATGGDFIPPRLVRKAVSKLVELRKIFLERCYPLLPQNEDLFLTRIQRIATLIQELDNIANRFIFGDREEEQLADITAEIELLQEQAPKIAELFREKKALQDFRDADVWRVNGPVHPFEPFPVNRFALIQAQFQLFYQIANHAREFALF